MTTMRMAFEAKYPNDSTTLKMYEAGSPAVSALDCIVPRHRLATWEAAWVAAQAAQPAQIPGYVLVPRELLGRALQAISVSIFGTDTYKVSSRGDFASKVEKEIHAALQAAPDTNQKEQSK